METTLLTVHVFSPLQAGTCQGIGAIDQPIAREKATNIPYVPGSTLKGVFRDMYASSNPSQVEDLFGPKTDNPDSFAGSLAIADARLLLLPVRSLTGLFAWVTSPYLLHRFVRDCMGIQFTYPIPGVVPEALGESCVVGTTPSLRVDNATVILEDMKLTPSISTDVDSWSAWLGNILFDADAYWKDSLKSRMCVVSDDLMGYFLDVGTQVTAHVRMEEGRKKVAKGALWYVESLPVETILVSLVAASKVKVNPADAFTALGNLTDKPVQLGGSETTGQGLCLTKLV